MVQRSAASLACFNLKLDKFLELSGGENFSACGYFEDGIRATSGNVRARRHERTLVRQREMNVIAANTRTLAASMRISAVSKPANIVAFDMGTSSSTPTPEIEKC